MLADISMLKPLSEGRPHLQFLLDPKNFDYAQVDFSDYMWENFARREEYMKTFVAHKEVIIPKIQKRIETGEVTEAEKRILYGFCSEETKFGRCKRLTGCIFARK